MSREFLWRGGLELALSPILLAQALYVRRTVEKLPEAEGPRQGCVGRGPPLRVLIFGDSAAAGVGVQAQETALSGQLAAALAQRHTVHWRLIASTGATTRSTLQTLQAQAAQTFDVAVASLGVNEATSGLAARRWPGLLDQLQALLRERFGVRHTWYAALPPMQDFPALPQPLRSLLGGRARALDQSLLNWCAAGTDRSRLALPLPIEPEHMARDGFHPGPGVYQLWGQTAAQLIAERFAAECSSSAGMNGRRAS
jgi:lysophospholipase L1-like esterase